MSDWKETCAKCMDGEIEPRHCEYYGEPNGCNSPTYGEHPPVGNAAAMRTSETNDTITDISAEIGEKSDYCHNNIGSKTWEDWEKIHEWLLDIRRRIETEVLRKAIELSKRFVPSNAAAMRDALKFVAHMDDNGYTSFDVYDAIKRAKHALSEPARNCDIYTTSKDADRAITEYCSKMAETGECAKSCPYRESEGGCAFGWLLATAAERKGEGDENN